MRTYRALFGVELDAIDKGEAEKKAKALLKRKKLKGKLFKIEEA